MIEKRQASGWQTVAPIHTNHRNPTFFVFALKIAEIEPPDRKRPRRRRCAAGSFSSRLWPTSSDAAEGLLLASRVRRADALAIGADAGDALVGQLGSARAAAFTGGLRHHALAG